MNLVEIFGFLDFTRNSPTNLTFLSRQYFGFYISLGHHYVFTIWLIDQDLGAELLQRLLLPIYLNNFILEKYIILSSCHALLKYLENTQQIQFCEKSLRLEMESSLCNEVFGKMMMNSSTVKHLELMRGIRGGGGKSGGKGSSISSSFFSSINKTKTAVGSRMLRSFILHPSTNKQVFFISLSLSSSFFWKTKTTDFGDEVWSHPFSPLFPYCVVWYGG